MGKRKPQFIRITKQSLKHNCSIILDPLQKLKVAMLGYVNQLTVNLDTGFEMVT